MSKTTTPTALDAVREARATVAAAEVEALRRVVEWAVEFRVDNSVVDDTTFGAGGVILGGVGCPLVDEFAAYDLAAVLGMSSDSGCTYIAKTLELRYRLRRIWEQVVALKVPVWKAFVVCERTLNLSYDAARYVDQMLAPTLRSCSFAQIERTVAHAIDLFDPDEAERRRLKAADDRDFQIHLGQRNHPTDGTVDVTGTLSTEDALDLEAAVKQGAKTLGDLGCEESLGARRSMAVGEMARQQLALNLGAGGDTGGRGVVIYAHIDADSPHVSLGNVGGGDVLIDQLKDWCRTAGTTVTIKPVIDLNEDLSTKAYVPTAKLVQQVRLRDQCCVFPNCTAGPSSATSTTACPSTRTTLMPVGKPPPRTSHSCAGSTTGPRPSAPGPTTHPNPGSTTGPAPPATTSASPADDATAGCRSPPRSTTHPSPEHPAPTPRRPRRGHRHVTGFRSSSLALLAPQPASAPACRDASSTLTGRRCLTRKSSSRPSRTCSRSPVGR